MNTARERAATVWGVAPAVVTATEPDAVSRPALPDVVPDATSTPDLAPFGTAWADYDAASAEELREALRIDERLGWAEEISGGVVRYPTAVERPWVRPVPQAGDTETH